MSNDYTPDLTPLAPGDLARSADLNERYENTVAGFDRLPAPAVGKKGFSDPVVGGEPTDDDHLATKNYIENTWLTPSDKAQLNGLNLTNLDTVAGSVANVNTTAGSIGNVNILAAAIANVNTAATNVADINTVAGINADVSAVALNNANISTVATDITNVNTTATNIADVNTTATNIAAVVTVANDLNEPLSEIDTVATSITDVNTVGTDIASVNTVATSIANVNTAAGNTTNINTVAGIDADVTTVAGINADVTTVAGISSDVTFVADNMGVISTVQTNAANAAAAQAATEAVYDSFDDRFLGAKAVDPTLDNDGDPLVIGAIYYNTINKDMRVWDGVEWKYGYSGQVPAVDASYDNTTSGMPANTVQEALDYLNVVTGGGGGGEQATYSRQSYTATNGQTTFTVAGGYTVGYLEVYLNGVLLPTGDYTANDESTFVLQTAAIAGDQLTAIALDSFEIAELLRVTDISPSAPDNAFQINADGSLTFVGGINGFATTAYVDSEIAGLVDTAPTTLDTLNELAAALGDDPNFATTMTNSLALKANSADLATVATSGAYADLSGTPTIPNSTTDFDPKGTDNSTNVTIAAGLDYVSITGQQLTLNQVDASTDISGLATVATSGAYGDLSGTPTIPNSTNDFDPKGTDNSTDVTLAGSYDYLTILGQEITLNQVDAATDITGLSTVATTNNYADLTGLPTLSTVAGTGAYSDLTGLPTLSTVAGTGAYSDLTGTPTLATVATSGAYSDLSGTPSLATVATSGSYSDLSGTPALNAIATASVGAWTVVDVAGVLHFQTGGVSKMKLDASGNLTVTGDVIAGGTM